MPSKSGTWIILFTTLAVLAVGLNYIWGQAYPLIPEGTTITVNTTADTISDDGFCSLREAVRAANLDTAIGGCPAGQGADIILLAGQVYTLSIAGQAEDAALTGDLDITADLEIRGQGMGITIVSAAGLDRVFHVDPNKDGVHVHLKDLTARSGFVPVTNSEGGGGILTNGNLELDHVLVEDNLGPRGGGLRVSFWGEATLRDSTVQDNVANSEGGGLYGDGPMIIERVKVLSNQAPRGGGVFCDSPCTFIDVTISGNNPFGGGTEGGGIYNDDISTLTNVTINNNRATQTGGGLYSEDEITLKNVTISANTAGQGSGFFNEAVAHLKNVTMYQNDSPIRGPGLYNAQSGYLDLVNTIIANENLLPNCSGDLLSLGNNLSNDNTCDLGQATDLVLTDPLLNDLFDNGGFTATHALQANSPAVDAGNNYSCTSYDQRYFIRPADGDADGDPRCDIGAYEIAPGGALGFNPLTFEVEEDVGNALIAVERTEGTVGEVSVSYFTWEGFSPDRANNNADYMYASGTLTWADGDNSVKYISVPIVDDPCVEADETFSVYLINATGGAGLVNARRLAIVTILANDPGGPVPTPVPEPDRVYLPLINE